MTGDLATLQRALARLCTDAPLRSRFLHEPQQVGPELGLSAATAQQWVQEIEPQLAGFSRSLLLKRMQEAAHCLPRTVAALGGSFKPLFLAYAVSPPPSVVNKPQAEALAFVRFLARPLQSRQILHKWIADLGRYEAAWIQIRTSVGPFVLRRFRFRVDALTPQARHSFGIWWRFPGINRVIHRMVAVPF
jgi:hypothetical protein